MKTRVCITIDTEFSIGGAFDNPMVNKPVGEQAVWWNICGESHGLGFILKTLTCHHLPATFFVEVFNTHYFGHEPMGAIANKILENNHDIQPHLHPCWTHFKTPHWQTRIEETPPNDSMAGRSVSELVDLMSYSIDIFKEWKMPAPTAIRTGNLHVDDNVYIAMSDLCLKLSSNIGLAIFKPPDENLQIYSGCHNVHGVLESPVTTYRDIQLKSLFHNKLLTITGSTFEEIKHILHSANKRKIGPIVILTHPFEFVKNIDLQYMHLKPNKLTQKRFQMLCQYLEKNKDLFEVTTFSQGYQDWLACCDSNNDIIKVPTLSALRRIIENKLNESFI